MSSKGVFDEQDYRKFILHWISEKPNHGHGEKSKIAQALNCHSAYLSQILVGKAELSTEQAFALCTYFGFSPKETDHFLLLVHYARAGTEKLKTYYRHQIETKQKEHSLLENRLTYQKALAPEDQATYFSSWHYAVIHLMIGTLPGFQNATAIEKVLPLSQKVIREAIQFLETSGLIFLEKDQYKMGSVDLHLADYSPMYMTNHTNWRMQAIRALDARNEDELHYSSVVTIHEDDFKLIKKTLVEAVLKTRDSVTASINESTVCALTLDWFKVIR